MVAYPEWLVSTLASDAMDGHGVLPETIRALSPGARLVGPARVALLTRDDNLSVRALMATPHAAGTVLVAAGGAASRAATIGGLMALELQQAGFIGLVTDGLVRDSQEIRACGFGVWCSGVTPMAPSKRGPVVVGGSVSLGGEVIRDDDLVIADDDGVVIWPHERISELLDKAHARLQSDNVRLAELQARKP